MNILHVTTYTTSGGAGVAAIRIIKALTLFNASNQTETFSTSILSSQDSLSQLIKSRIAAYVCKKLSVHRGRQSIDLFPSALHHQINSSDCDIVHLHWCHDEFLPIESILQIRKPIVWTLHDHWPLQGAHHLPQTSPINAYEAKPFFSKRLFNFDFDQWCYHRKRQLASKEIVLVSPSSWIRERSASSPHFSSIPCHVVPNPLHSDELQRIPRLLARAKHNLNPQRVIIFFAANNFTTDNNKGFYLLIEALSFLRDLHNLTLVTAGDYYNSPINGTDHINLGPIKSMDVMVELFCASDLTVVPSIFDNMPQIATESLYLGTPVVGFDCGGLRDIVTHPTLGLLARPYSSPDLASQIRKRLLTNAPLTNQSEYLDFLQNVSPSSVSENYVRIYKMLLNKHLV